MKRRRPGFWRAEDGAATVEFVVMIPFVIAMIAFVGGYGQVMYERERLDSAVFDAARFLSRAPMQAVGTGTDANGRPVPAEYNYFRLEARAMIADRMGIDIDGIAEGSAQSNVEVSVAVTELVAPTNAENTNGYYLLDVTATASFESGLLEIVEAFGFLPTSRPDVFTLSTSREIPWLSGIAPGDTACTDADLIAGNCT